MPLKDVRCVLLILSGKGGVGKSTISCQLALALQQLGFKVGLLDIDICGPSIPRMLNLIGQDVSQGEHGWIPIKYRKADKPDMHVMSIGFLLNNQDTAVIWRGPRKHAMINQFLSDVDWNDLDYLLIDTPPGTSDEHISIVETLKKYPQIHTNAILVTTPQSLAVGDVRREITFCHKGDVEILGIVENMNGFICEHCSECTKIFSSDGGKLLAEYANIEFLISIPIEPKLTECCDQGSDFIEKYRNSETFNLIMELSDRICQKTRIMKT